ncbi:substrate-binding domain-containing protein [Metasolibacillus sp. FSL H7-0170]|uniref:substrate-binding domain-containing protein n=1 Tax=Metasolibacillus sp. FSL H7-0170 TaxID=2921431 RepID=UPI003159086F
MKKFKAVFGSMLLVSGLMLGACSDKGGSSEGSNGGDKEFKIAGVLMQSDVEWFKQIQYGMERAAKEYNVDLKIGNSNLDLATESSLFDTYTSQGMDAIIVSAIDSSSSVEAIKRAQEKDVLIVNYNTNVDEDVMEYYVGIDNFELGAQAGRKVAEYVQNELGGQAKIGMVTLSMFEVGIKRAEGFLAEISKVPGIEIVSQQDANGPENGMSVAETMIQANPDIDVMWAANGGTTHGVVQGIISKGLQDRIKFFGTDMDLQSANALLDPANPYQAVSTQDPEKIGYESVKAAVKALKGESVDSNIVVDLDFFTKEDKEKLEQYIEKYKNL